MPRTRTSSSRGATPGSGPGGRGDPGVIGLPTFFWIASLALARTDELPSEEGKLYRLALARAFRRSKAPVASQGVQPPSENLCRLDNRAVEKICVGAPVKASSALPNAEPFELITPARTAAAPDWPELELLDATVKFVAAPEPGP